MRLGAERQPDGRIAVAGQSERTACRRGVSAMVRIVAPGLEGPYARGRAPVLMAINPPSSGHHATSTKPRARMRAATPAAPA